MRETHIPHSNQTPTRAGKRSQAQKMTEDHTEVFESALGLAWPWYVDRISFDDESRMLLIHLDSFGCRTFLQGLSPRVACPSCGVRQVVVPWARSRQRLTLPFEAMVVELAREMPIRAVSRLVGEHDTRLRRIVNHCGSGRS